MLNFVKLKKHYIMALAVMFVFVSLSSTTYSLFLKTDSTNTITQTTGLFDLQFVEDEQISIQNAFPIIDSEGLKTNPYTLTIKNYGTLPLVFDLQMTSTTQDNVIDTKYIKYQVNNDKVNNLSATSNIISSNNIIFPNEEITFKIKVWLDINTPNSELGKTFIANIKITGYAAYKTLDTSGANYPTLTDDMIPVYYDETSKTWNKADQSNTISDYTWYNYDTQKWANTVSIKSSNKQIYDITRNNDLKIKEARTNNGNYLTDESALDVGLSNYNYKSISNIFRIKFNDLNQDNIYIISNGKLSYYYDTNKNKFIFKVGNNIVSSQNYNIETNKWYILGYTYDMNKVTFYINGEKISSASIHGDIKTNNNFLIGIESSSKQLSNLELGDIYFYKNILTEKVIKENYNSTINIVYDNLIAGYNDFEPKTLKEYYLSNPMGTTIYEEDIVSQYVWIPRFKYKLWNVTGSNEIDSYDAATKGIDIIFENQASTSGVIKCQNYSCYIDDLQITKVTTNDNNKYYTHPAFTTSEKELTGIWVSKYEVSTACDLGTNSCLSKELNIESKKGNTTWRNNYLSYFYENIKSLTTNDNNYHMIKNTEWGAISYLTHSKYGLCKDNKCSTMGTNKTYISGNDNTDSTTNNMYGVFDLSGSAAEFVMAGYTTTNSLNLSNTHFTINIINPNDYDIYQPNTFILGDATKEISSWTNNNASQFINETNNWFIRGGIGESTHNGIFYYNGTTDTNSEYITTRIVIQ